MDSAKDSLPETMRNGFSWSSWKLARGGAMDKPPCRFLELNYEWVGYYDSPYSMLIWCFCDLRWIGFFSGVAVLCIFQGASGRAGGRECSIPQVHHLLLPFRWHDPHWGTDLVHISNSLYSLLAFPSLQHYSKFSCKVNISRRISTTLQDYVLK